MCKALHGILFRHPAFMMHNKPQVCAASKPRAAFYPPALLLRVLSKVVAPYQYDHPNVTNAP